jgi:acyl-coenzyme A thioesterase PaaI-like protein
MEPLLNRDLLPHNQCFGCGLENTAGLCIEVGRDPASESSLRGRFIPTSHMAGFPGITHGGAIYTALDCLATWVSTVLGPNRSALWILRSATTTYHKPAPPGQPLALAGAIKHQAGAWDPIVVRAEARRADGALCVEAEFKEVPLSVEKFTTIAGIAELPANWRQFLSGAA